MSGGLILTFVAIFGLFNMALGYMAATLVERQKAAAEDQLEQQKRLKEAAKDGQGASGGEGTADGSEEAEAKPKRKPRPRPKRKRSFNKKAAADEEAAADATKPTDEESEEAAPNQDGNSEEESQATPEADGNSNEQEDLAPAARGDGAEDELKQSERDVKQPDDLKSGDWSPKEQDDNELAPAARGEAPPEDDDESDGGDGPQNSADAESNPDDDNDEPTMPPSVTYGEPPEEAEASEPSDDNTADPSLEIGPLADLVGVCQRLGDEAEISRQELDDYLNAPDTESFQHSIEDLDDFVQRALAELQGGIENISESQNKSTATQLLDGVNRKLSTILEGVKDLNYDKRSQQESFSKLKSANNKICNELKELRGSLSDCM